MEAQPASGFRRVLWLVLAYVALALACVGAVLPVVPTTPFVLLAAFAAARGSRRLHDRLLAHRVFGPLIRDWRAGGAVARRAKVAAVGTMAASVAIMLAIGVPARVVALSGVPMVLVSVWLCARPEPAASSDPTEVEGERPAELVSGAD